MLYSLSYLDVILSILYGISCYCLSNRRRQSRLGGYYSLQTTSFKVLAFRLVINSIDPTHKKTEGKCGRGSGAVDTE